MRNNLQINLVVYLENWLVEPFGHTNLQFLLAKRKQNNLLVWWFVGLDACNGILKHRQTLGVFGRSKTVHFRCNYLFLENGPFFVPIQSHQTLHKLGLQEAQGCKSAILGRGIERGFAICDT